MKDRWSHQPVAAGTRNAENEPTRSELASACGKIAALVLARDAGTASLSVVEENGSVTQSEGAHLPRPLQLYRGQPIVCAMVAMLNECGITAIEVSAAEGLLSDIGNQLAKNGTPVAAELSPGAQGGVSRDGSSPVAALTAYDPNLDLRETLSHGKFEVFDLGFGTLRQARDLARASHAEAVLVIPCDIASFKPRHVLQMANALHERPEAEVIASWAVWRNRPPYLLRASFLDSLDASTRCQASPNAAYHPLPHLKVHEVVFGEEMLMATPPASDPARAFFETCNMSALETVRKVRVEQEEAARSAGNAEALAKSKAQAEAAAKRNAAYTETPLPDGPSESDETLLETTRQVLEKLDAVQAKAGASLKAWDVWARRNKLDFPIFNDRAQRGSLVYLDSAATTQRVGRALDAQYHFDAFENANIYRGAYALSTQSTATFNDARTRIEQFIGAERRSVIFTANTSAAAALVAQAWGEHNIGSGDRIVVPATEHHSNLVPWLMLAQRKDAHIDYIPTRDDGSLDEVTYLELLKQGPKLVCVAQVSNVLGMVNPVEKMAEAAHEAGARVYVDAAQSFPHLAIDVRKLGADFLGFAAHKAYGPMGIGCLWTSAEAFDEMDPIVGGGGTVSHVGLDSYYLRGKAIQYELGTPPVSQAVGFAAAVEYLRELGMDAVEEHGAAMTRFLVDGLRELEDLLGGVRIWGDHEGRSGQTGLVAFSLAGIPANHVASTLGKLGVCVRTGGHCALPLHASLGLAGSVRFSFGVHTTVEDIEAGLVALVICRHIHREAQL